jgi:tRNA A37 threonylcarbamoyladenosine synthetase subunit TsaC/SUA5/YrdC
MVKPTRNQRNTLKHHCFALRFKLQFTMAQFLQVHPDNPQVRLLKQAVALLAKGGVVAVPTDSSYALVCHLDDKAAVEHMRRIRLVDDKHHLTLMCLSLIHI